MNMEPGEEETMKAMTSSSAKMAATYEEKFKKICKELLIELPKLQGGLEKMGVPINRNKGTVTQADQKEK